MDKDVLKFDPNACKHKMDPFTERYDHKLGRVGYCKKCKNKIYRAVINSNPKRERPKMKKKERRKLNKLVREKQNDE